MDNYCVCCGALVPEGRMVCPKCEAEADERLKRMGGGDTMTAAMYPALLIAGGGCIYRAKIAR